MDPFDNGRCFARVYDLASGKLLFSRGFDSYFGEYRTTEQAGKSVRRAYHESVLMPKPKAKVRFALELRGADRKLKEAWSTEIDPGSWEIVREKPDPSVLVMPSHVSGDPHARLDVAILGEGYTLAEVGKFRADLDRFTGILLGAEPYARVKDRINVYGVLKPSDESGIDEPSHGSYRRTALGATFDSLGSERYVLTEDNRALQAVAPRCRTTRSTSWSTRRAGGGGIYELYSTFTTDNQWHRYIFLHSSGHSFGVADEYYTSRRRTTSSPAGLEPADYHGARTGARQVGDVLTLREGPDAVGRGRLRHWTWRTRSSGSSSTRIRRQASRRAGRVAKIVESGSCHGCPEDGRLPASSGSSGWSASSRAGYSRRVYRPMLDCLMFTKGDKPLCRVCRPQWSAGSTTSGSDLPAVRSATRGSGRGVGVQGGEGFVPGPVGSAPGGVAGSSLVMF